MHYPLQNAEAIVMKAWLKRDSRVVWIMMEAWMKRGGSMERAVRAMA